MNNRPGAVLGSGIAAILIAALSPAGLTGAGIPPWAWVVWALALAGAFTVFLWAGGTFAGTLRRMAWLLPVVAVFVVPAAWLAPPGSRGPVAAALLLRAWSAASLGSAIAMALGPSGLARAVRQLGVPGRLAEVFEATLSSLAIILRQVRSMLRAREARRPGFGAWSAVAVSPIETVRGFGRLVAALLLRSLERGEAVEQARRARGGSL
jgi:energy-coupling factor transporter transmembrane protein EcfT